MWKDIFSLQRWSIEWTQCEFPRRDGRAQLIEETTHIDDRSGRFLFFQLWKRIFRETNFIEKFSGRTSNWRRNLFSTRVGCWTFSSLIDKSSLSFDWLTKNFVGQLIFHLEMFSMAQRRQRSNDWKVERKLLVVEKRLCHEERERICPSRSR